MKAIKMLGGVGGKMVRVNLFRALEVSQRLEAICGSIYPRKKTVSQ